MAGDPPNPAADLAARGWREHTRVVGGQRLRSLEAGDEGRPVALLLHGLPGGAEGWSRLAPELISGFHVIAVDRPGYGGTGGNARSVPDQTAVMAELLRELDAGPALIVGHSFGTVVAAGLACDEPEVVGALGLIAPALHLDQWAPPGFDRLVAAVGSGFGGAVLEATLLSARGRARLAEVVVPESFRPDAVDEQNVVDTRDRVLLLQSIRSGMAEAQGAQAEAARLAEKLGALTVPAVVIHATGDRQVPPAAAIRSARSIPRCGLHEIDGGHMLTISRADEVAGALLGLAARAGLVSRP